MDSYARMADVFKQAFSSNKTLAMQVGTVKEVNGDVCSVDFGGLVISKVRLKVQIGESADRLISIPAIGSLVLCGSLTGDYKDMIVLKAERVDVLKYDEGGMSIEIDSQGGKVKVTNGTVSLKDLFDDLKTIIEQLKVFTPAGPSGTPLPDTVARLAELGGKVDQLLK